MSVHEDFDIVYVMFGRYCKAIVMILNVTRLRRFGIRHPAKCPNVLIVSPDGILYFVTILIVTHAYVWYVVTRDICLNAFRTCPDDFDIYG